MVMGVEDAAGQLHQFPVVAEEQELLHSRFSGSHQQRAHPVAGLSWG